jgi:tellurite resistance protein TehA-like permease
MQSGEEAPLLSSSRANSSSLLSHQIKLLEYIPPSINGLALGFCGLGITWQSTELLSAPSFIRVIADVIALIAFNIGTTLLLIYICKIIFASRHALQDLLTPSGNATLPCLDMSLMMLSVWLYGHGLHNVATNLWFFATAIHVFLLVFFMRHLARGDWDQVTPSWMVPPIGIALAGGTGTSIGIGAGASIFFWAGLGAFFFALPATLYRAHAYPVPPAPGDDALYPIFAAPAALLLTNWIALGGHQGHTLTHFLFLAEIVCLALVAVRLPTLAAMPFSPQQAAFTFPADVAAKSFILYAHLYRADGALLAAAAWVLVAVATFAVFNIFARFCAVAAESVKEPVPSPQHPPLSSGSELL